MRVRIEPAEQNDIAINRIRDALKMYSPDGLEFIENHADFDVDLLVMIVNGRCGRTKRRMAEARKYDADIAVMQISLASTRNPFVKDWMPLWSYAKRIWSYYDLPQISRDQGVEPKFEDKFYHAPLGVDSDVFKPSGARKEYMAVAVTKGYLTESTREILAAVRHFGVMAAYVGPHINGLDGVDQFTGITDEELADLYSKSFYAPALRRLEGQDLPAAEGLLCGARPIVFDRPDQTWSPSFLTIPEVDREQIIGDLIKVFRSDYAEVSQSEIEYAKEIFDWQKFAEGFWSWL